MPIFKESDGKLQKLRPLSADREKGLQSLIEKNLEEVLDMYFLASEYTTTFGGRIDTLAVDYNGAPVIIEYKKNRNDTVINQALSYLKWLQAQKVEFFEMLIIKKLGPDVAEKINIDWRNPRVVCVAESFSKFDIDTVEVIPMRIELFKYRYYDEGIFSLEPLSISEQKSQTNSLKSPEKPTIDTTIDTLSAKANQETRELFEQLRSMIFSIDENIKEKATNYYVAYRVTKNFAEVYFSKNQLQLLLRPIEYHDDRHIVEKVPDSYQWTLDRRVYLKSQNDLDYVFSLIEQSYKDVL